MNKQTLIEELARFLVNQQVAKGVALETERKRPKHLSEGKPKFAQEWAALRTAAGISGYMKEAKAVAHLTRLLA